MPKESLSISQIDKAFNEFAKMISEKQRDCGVTKIERSNEKLIVNGRVICCPDSVSEVSYFDWRRQNQEAY